MKVPQVVLKAVSLIKCEFLTPTLHFQLVGDNSYAKFSKRCIRKFEIYTCTCKICELVHEIMKTMFLPNYYMTTCAFRTRPMWFAGMTHTANDITVILFLHSACHGRFLTNYLFIYLLNNLFKVDKFTKIQYIYIYIKVARQIG